MTRFACTALALALSLAIALSESAACPPQAVVRQKVVLQQAYATQAAYTPVYAVIPVYAVQYAPVSESAENAILAQLEAMRAELKAELAALRDRAVLPEAMKVAKANVVGARCATCHAPEVADDAGGGVHLLNADGSVAKLRAVELRAVARVLNNDSMPKGTKDKPLPRLTAEEKAEVARLFGLEPSKGPSPAPKLPIPKK